MTRKQTRPISHVIQFGNVIMWPVIPELHQGVNLACQPTVQGGKNVVVLPVIQIPGRTNWMDHVHLKPTDIGVVLATMRSQRNNKHSSDAMEALRMLFMNPA